MNFISVIFRTLVFYIVITVVYRMMGKREIGELGIIDIIVSVLIAELAAIGIENSKQNILIPILAIFSLVLLQVIMAKITIKNSKIRDLFEGKPSVIINRGKVNFKEMVKQRYSLDDLLSGLRDKSIRSIEEVDYAILENNGRLSIFTKGSSTTYPLPLIQDGVIDEDALRQLGKDINWLKKIISKERVNLANIFYGFYKKDQIFIIKKSDLQD